jgi:hypothetical protein
LYRNCKVTPKNGVAVIEAKFNNRNQFPERHERKKGNPEKGYKLIYEKNQYNHEEHDPPRIGAFFYFSKF